MDNTRKSNSSSNGGNAGLKKLVDKCRIEFRRPENTDHYSEADLREAEKKFLRFCVKGN